MSTADRNLFLCSCNGTQPLDAGAISRALDLKEAPQVSTMLCQKEMARFSKVVTGKGCFVPALAARVCHNERLTIPRVQRVGPPHGPG